MNGIRYFKCRSRHGVFVRHDKLIMDKKRRGSRKRASTDSKRHSMGNMQNRSPASANPTKNLHAGNSGNFMKSTNSSSAKRTVRLFFNHLQIHRNLLLRFYIFSSDEKGACKLGEICL